MFSTKQVQNYEIVFFKIFRETYLACPEHKTNKIFFQCLTS